MGDRDELALRPVQETDLSYFTDAATTAADQDPFNFFGFKRTFTVARAWHEDGLLTPEGGTLLVTLDERVVGDVGWHAQPYGPPGAGHALNIGIRLLPAQRGVGLGTRAQRMLVGYLFATYPVNRVDAGTDVDNVAEQRALEKAGFRRDGVLRGAQWRAGGWHDLVLYSRLRGDP